MQVATIRSRPSSRGREGVAWDRLLPASLLTLVLTFVLALAPTLALTSLVMPGQARATESAAIDLAQAARNSEATEANSPAPLPSSSSGDPALTGEALAGAELEPLPRFTVGWYCPAPNRNPGREALAFGLGVILIWAMAERKKARQASAQARDTVSH